MKPIINMSEDVHQRTLDVMKAPGTEILAFRRLLKAPGTSFVGKYKNGLFLIKISLSLSLSSLSRPHFFGILWDP